MPSCAHLSAVADGASGRLRPGSSGVTGHAREAAGHGPTRTFRRGGLRLAQVALDLLLTKEFVTAARGRPVGNGDRAWNSRSQGRNRRSNDLDLAPL